MRSLFRLTAFFPLSAFEFSNGLVAAKDVGRATSEYQKLNTDSDWPLPETWRTSFPGIILKESKARGAAPDYRIRVRNTADVIKAVHFANQHNIRLSVIATGHDFWLEVMQHQAF
jgi:FAD/FMN-containing dehydrogenase